MKTELHTPPQEMLFDSEQVSEATVRWKYPKVAGYKAEGTSRESAERIEAKASILRKRCYEALKLFPSSADDLAQYLNESILSVRPRCSELLALGKIKDSGKRVRNVSGHAATVWEAT